MLLLFVQLYWIIPVVCGFLQSSSQPALEVCRLEPKLEPFPDALESEALGEHKEYMTVWSVNIPEGRKTADEIAEKHGFINIGLVNVLHKKNT